MTSSCSFARYMYTAACCTNTFMTRTQAHTHARCVSLAVTAPFPTPTFWHSLTRSPMVGMSPQLPMSSTMLD